MITEFAEIDVQPGMEESFIAGVQASLPLFARATGCHGAVLHHSLESPQHFVLVVRWDSVADHTEKFQKSPDYQTWRANVGRFFAGPPKVWHSATAAAS